MKAISGLCIMCSDFVYILIYCPCIVNSDRELQPQWFQHMLRIPGAILVQENRSASCLEFDAEIGICPAIFRKHELLKKNGFTQFRMQHFFDIVLSDSFIKHPKNLQAQLTTIIVKSNGKSARK